MVGDNAYALAIETRKARDDILGKLRLNFEEFSVVNNSADDLIHIIRLVGILRNNFVEQVFLAVDGVVALNTRSIFGVVGRDVREECLDEFHALFFGLCREMCNTTLACMNACTT